jgi:peptide/nickel transport system substrate-binding protein
VLCALVGFAFAGGSQETGSTEGAAAGGTVAGKEAPMLAAKVTAGELPPLAERLPEVPFVVASGVLLSESDIDWEVGRYGGTLRTARNNVNWNPDVFVMNNEPLVMGPGISGEDIIPGVVQDFDVNDEFSEFTFYLRKGLKWSDGTPVTTEDVRFAYEDVLLNEKLTPVFPSWMRSGNSANGEPMTLEVIDDFSFRISFTEQYGGFLTQLAIVGWRGYQDLLKPKHHLTRFHADYTDMEDLEPLIAEQELSEGEWWTLFQTEDIAHTQITNPNALGFPMLTPWIMVEETQSFIHYERNPYYYKVDTEGQQLPYIDGIRDSLVSDIETVTLKVMSGEVDYLYEAGAMITVPLYKENESRGDYRTILLRSHTEPATLYFNMTHPDPVWRDVVGDVRFRRAVSLSLDREQIIDAVWLDVGAEFPVLQPSEYDPQEARALLDALGLDERDAEGYRLGPDGETFTIPFELSSRTPEMLPTAEIVSEFLRDVGLHTTVKTIDSQLRGQRRDANELRATIERNNQPMTWQHHRGWYQPVEWGPLWHLWNSTGGRDGEEPPAVVKEFLELTGRAITALPEDRVEIREEYRQIQYDNIFFITPVEKERRPIIAKDNLRNVAHDGFSIASCFAGEQFFFAE